MDYDDNDIAMFGEDAVEIENTKKDEYQEVSTERKAKRAAREEAEDQKEKVELDFLQPRKARRFKLYLKYEGRKGPPLVIKTRLPKTGAYEDGPSKYIKRLFLREYNKNQQLITQHQCHLRSDLGIQIPETDAISGYIGYGGLIYIVDGSESHKPAENCLYAWGKCSFSEVEGDMPSLVMSLQYKRILTISCGTEHAAAVGEGGRAFTWGANDFGQLGTGDEEVRPIPQLCDLSYEVFVQGVSCGSRFTLAWTKSGDLFSWGRYQASNFPRKFVDTWCNGYEVKGEMGIRDKKVKTASAGEQHMAVVTRDGEVFTWGYNDFGQLGWGLHGVDRTGQQKPQKLEGLLEDEQVIGIVCGGGHTICWTKEGKAFSWGSNASGQIGQALKQIYSTPEELPFSTKVVGAAAGWMMSCVLGEDGVSMVLGGLQAEVEAPKTDGEVPPGQEKTSAPEGPKGSVMELVGTGANLSDHKIKQASLGHAHAIGLQDDGLIIGWGYNRFAQAVGHFNTPTYANLEQVIMADAGASNMKAVQVCAGGSQSYGLLKP